MTGHRSYNFRYSHIPLNIMSAAPELFQLGGYKLSQSQVLKLMSIARCQSTGVRNDVRCQPVACKQKSPHADILSTRIGGCVVVQYSHKITK
jgi:hypothetical protein